MGPSPGDLEGSSDLRVPVSLGGLAGGDAALGEDSVLAPAALWRSVMGLLYVSQVILDRWCLRTKLCLEGTRSAVKEGRGCQDHARHTAAGPQGASTGLVASFAKFHILGFLRLNRNLTDSQRRLHFRVRGRPLQSTSASVTNSAQEDFRGP